MKCGKQGSNMISLWKRVDTEESAEYFDIRTPEGRLTGRIKERGAVHRDGDWHGTAHIWVAKRGEDGSLRLLLQKRSLCKDSFPGYWDISAAGHLSAGDGFEEGAYRELWEELGIRAEPGELQFLFLMGRKILEEVSGKQIDNREIAAVYLYDSPVEIGSLTLQEKEVDEVKWVGLAELEDWLESGRGDCCIYGGEIRKLKQYLEGRYTDGK